MCNCHRRDCDSCNPRWFTEPGLISWDDLHAQNERDRAELRAAAAAQVEEG